MTVRCDPLLIVDTSLFKLPVLLSHDIYSIYILQLNNFHSPIFCISLAQLSEATKLYWYRHAPTGIMPVPRHCASLLTPHHLYNTVIYVRRWDSFERVVQAKLWDYLFPELSCGFGYTVTKVQLQAEGVRTVGMSLFSRSKPSLSVVSIYLSDNRKTHTPRHACLWKGSEVPNAFKGNTMRILNEPSCRHQFHLKIIINCTSHA